MLYPTDRVRVDEDSSFWMMWELNRRGHEVSYFTSQDMAWSGDSVIARMKPALLHTRRGFLPAATRPRPVDLTSQDCVFIRKEPPFDDEYLYSLQLLELIKHRVFIVNDPAGVALANEKTFILRFGAWSPDTLVTANIEDAVRYIRSVRKNVVIKPLNHKGGYGVFVTNSRDRNLHGILELSTQLGRTKVIIQQYLPVDRVGDKRIVVLEGQILGAFLRRPGRRDHRANLSAGGTMHGTRVTAQERKLVSAISPTLNRYGLYFTGLDCVDGKLTEINVTSPAGIPEIRKFDAVRAEKNVADFIERRTLSFVRKYS